MSDISRYHDIDAALGICSRERRALEGKLAAAREEIRLLKLPWEYPWLCEKCGAPFDPSQQTVPEAGDG